jgi:hypothetical protein
VNVQQREPQMRRAILASEAWAKDVRDHVNGLPKGFTLTSDELVEQFGLPNPGRGLNHNNAVGAVVHALAKTGKIKPTGDFTTSRHGSTIKVWIVTD